MHIASLCANELALSGSQPVRRKSTVINYFCSDMHCSRESGNRLCSITSHPRPQFRTKGADSQHAIVTVPAPNSRLSITLAVHNKKSLTSPMRCYRSKQFMGSRASPKLTLWAVVLFPLPGSRRTDKQAYYHFVRRLACQFGSTKRIKNAKN